jgi:hypothetical protein
VVPEGKSVFKGSIARTTIIMRRASIPVLLQIFVCRVFFFATEVVVRRISLVHPESIFVDEVTIATDTIVHSFRL